MKRLVFSVSLCLCGLFLFVAASGQAQIKEYTRWVNPFIGTGGHGHTFPGATMPFGMVQLSPDTRIDNWDGSSGYHYSDNIIYGFSHTHLSGTGIPDGCDILFMPTIDSARDFSPQIKLDLNKVTPQFKGFASTFSHADEKAEPGYYSVRIDDGKLLAELTATTRVGFHRYTFPRSDKAGIDLDLLWRDKVIDADAKVVGDRRIEGYRRSASWAKDQKVYFVAEFSKPFEGYGEGFGSHQKWKSQGKFFAFKTKEGEQILLKVAISFVSIEGARKNLAAELPHWKFDKVRADAKAAWNKELGKIDVSGGTPDQRTNFYTALYHTMIQPNVFNDVDGRYKGHDGKIHQLPAKDLKPVVVNKWLVENPNRFGPPYEGSQYSVFSLWDTFRAAHPLYTIIDQRRTVDFINTFIRQYEQGGRLPVWELWGEETDTMIGYHAVSVIADAMAKGIKGFDYEKAYAAAKHSAALDHFGLAAYKRRGYISMEDENESVSRTLEYAYNDWCIAEMAKILARRNAGSLPASQKHTQAGSLRSDIETYSRRARYFENLYDKRTGFFRPKKNGAFISPFGASEVNFAFTEGNSWQYSFFVPHDVSRLMELRGGKEKFAAWVDELFNTEQKLTGREQADLTGLIGQYAHGNEPSHHIAYLYNYAGQPWKTQKMVRKIMDEFYRNAPDGLIGNEDCGQMSAWYVMSALGFYQVNPGGTDYAIGAPLFPRSVIRLENGKTFTITSWSKPALSPPPGVSYIGLAPQPVIYIASAKLNGQPHRKSYFSHADLMRGGTLAFEMSQFPTQRAFTEAPVSQIGIETAVVPVVDSARTFSDGATVRFEVPDYERIFYTTDGSEPTINSTKYDGPIVIFKTTRFKAITVTASGTISPPVESVITRRPNDWTAKVPSGYSTLYTGGGDDAIIDGIRGTTNFASGEWQGIQGKPYEAVVDLKRMTDVNEVGASFLQVAGPWIWMPHRIEFEVSSDGVSFTRVAEIKTAFPQREMTPTIKEYRQSITQTRARYVRLRAFNFGKIPSWHPGAGGDPWIFIDEIFVR